MQRDDETEKGTDGCISKRHADSCGGRMSLSARNTQLSGNKSALVHLPRLLKNVKDADKLLTDEQGLRDNGLASISQC